MKNKALDFKIKYLKPNLIQRLLNKSINSKKINMIHHDEISFLKYNSDKRKTLLSKEDKQSKKRKRYYPFEMVNEILHLFITKNNKELSNAINLLRWKYKLKKI